MVGEGHRREGVEKEGRGGRLAEHEEDPLPTLIELQ